MVCFPLLLFSTSVRQRHSSSGLDHRAVGRPVGGPGEDERASFPLFAQHGQVGPTNSTSSNLFKSRGPSPSSATTSNSPRGCLFRGNRLFVSLEIACILDHVAWIRQCTIRVRLLFRTAEARRNFHEGFSSDLLRLRIERRAQAKGRLRRLGNGQGHQHGRVLPLPAVAHLRQWTLHAVPGRRRRS